jgi:hypothetical protein
MAIATAFVVAGISTATIAFADGMPYSKSANKVEPAMTPLDKAVNEVENKEPPVAVTTPAPAEVTQTIEQDEPAAMSEPPPVPESRIVEVQPNTSFFGLSVGMYDAVSHDEKAAAFNLEWQPGTKIAGFLQPLFGAMVSTEGSMMGYGGVGVPFHIGKSIFMMPSVAVGAYKEGAGYDLGRTIAFRVGTELGYEFEDKSRIGLNVHAITNGESLHARDRVDVISLVYTTPTNVFSGGSSTDSE